MDPVTAAIAVKGVQEVSGGIVKAAEAVGEGFDAVLKAVLNPDGANNVNEEELFAGIIKERLTKLKGADVAAKYDTALAAEKTKLTENGYVPVEQAAENALKSLVESKDLTADEAAQIRAESFEAAQLDDNTDKLFDSIGSEKDKTVAVMGLEQAIERARAVIDAFDSGERKAVIKTAATDAAAVTPQGTTIDGAGSGFLWKPESDHTGDLVVVLPPDLAGMVESVAIKDSAGNEVEQGTSSGMGNPDANGEREHFRFTKAGAEYPKDLMLEITLSNGSKKIYSIPDPGTRYD